MVVDDVLGVPNLSDEIDQIPLGTQVLPWTDLQPAKRPERGPMYPDDVLPTIGMVAASRHDDPDQAQMVHTDNEHALRVYIVNAADFPKGGGLGPAIQVFGDGNVINANTVWTSVEAGDATLWDGATRLTVPKAGSYLIEFSQTIEVSPGANYVTDGAAYQSEQVIRVNGHIMVLENADHDFGSSYFTFGQEITDRVAAVLDLAANDYVQFYSAYNTEDASVAPFIARAFLARVM